MGSDEGRICAALLRLRIRRTRQLLTTRLRFARPQEVRVKIFERVLIDLHTEFDEWAQRVLTAGREILNLRWDGYRHRGQFKECGLLPFLANSRLPLPLKRIGFIGS
jgi:hypothetical protein